MTLPWIVPRSFSLFAQLLLTFVVLMGATVTALTLVAYNASVENLLNQVRREAALAARGRADLLSLLLDLREQRAGGFLAGVESVCGEPAGEGRFAFASDCLRGLLTEFRRTEGAIGALFVYDDRVLGRAGESLDLPLPKGPEWTVQRHAAGDATYVLQATRGAAVLTMEFRGTAVQSIFAAPGDADRARTVFLLEASGRPLTPTGQTPGPLFADAVADCQTGGGPDEQTTESGGRRVIERLAPVAALGGACVVAQIDYEETTRQPAAELRRDLVVRGLTFVLGGVLLSLVAARRIAAPVRRLADTARALQSGEFGRPVPVAGPSEVRALGQAFVAMSNDLADLVAREQTGRREAEAANRSKDQFLAMLSHELRTPLTAVLGWAHTLRAADAPPERVRRAATAIERSAEAQRQLIEDLLDVAGIAAGRVRMAPAPTVVDPVVEAAVDAVAPQAEDKGVELVTCIEDEGLVVYADPQRLQQIVWNLVWNAVKYTPSGGTVHVRVRAGGSLVELIVSDTGIGIDAEFLPHVFGWFRRAEPDRMPAHEGLGLGLALVRQLVELHGGSVRAESAGRERGSTFVVSFPVYDEARHDEDARDETAARVSLSSIRALVVDDDAGSREAVRVLLEQAGAQVTTAASAADARRHLRAGGADVLISDIAMSEMSGYSLMETLRAEGLTIPGIALTGYARREDVDRAYAAGFDVHLPKPVDPDVLLSVLAALTTRQAPG